MKKVMPRKPGEASESRQAAERFWHLAEAARAIVWEARADSWEFTCVSPQAEAILGYPAEEWYTPDFWINHIDPEDRAWVTQFCKESSARYRRYQFEYRMLARDGGIVWLHDLVTVRRTKPAVLRGLMIDITDRKLAEQKLKDMAGRLVSAREEEGRRLARDLHDTLSQELAALGMETSALRQQLGKTTTVGRTVATISNRILRLARQVQQFSRNLHPSIVENLGLPGSLQSECSAFSRRHHIVVKLDFTGLLEPLSGDLSLTLYRVVQEALHNVRTHARATDVQVSLHRIDDALLLQVEDNGVGFDRLQFTPGLGLISMEERLSLVGGRLQIDSGPGAGTQLRVWVPLVQQ